MAQIKLNADSPLAQALARHVLALKPLTLSLKMDDGDFSPMTNVIDSEGSQEMAITLYSDGRVHVFVKEWKV